MADSKPLHLLTASEALPLLRSGSVSVETYAKALLARIDARDEAVKAWAYLDPVYVLDQARALDGLPADKRGPLHGLPVAIKDVIYTKGECAGKEYTGTCFRKRKRNEQTKRRGRVQG